MPDVREATIIINGTELTQEQSRAVRVCVSLFLMEMKNFPVTSGIGIATQEAYQRSCTDVFQMIERTRA